MHRIHHGWENDQVLMTCDLDLLVMGTNYDCSVDRLQFEESMQVAMQAWRESRKRGVWLKVPREKSNLIPSAISVLGFDFHHAEPG